MVQNRTKADREVNDKVSRYFRQKYMEEYEIFEQ